MAEGAHGNGNGGFGETALPRMANIKVAHGVLAMLKKARRDAVRYLFGHGEDAMRYLI